jgi:hypothetical protein
MYHLLLGVYQTAPSGASAFKVSSSGILEIDAVTMVSKIMLHSYE